MVVLFRRDAESLHISGDLTHDGELHHNILLFSVRKVTVAMDLIGWRKQWPKMWENPSLRGRTNHLIIWMWILDHAMWKTGVQVRFNNQVMELKRGQLTCGSLQIAMDTGCAASTVSRVLNDLNRERLIERQTDNRCSLITVTNWDKYQGDERQNEKQMRGRREADESQVRTKEEDKNIRNTDNSPSESESTPSAEAKLFFESTDVQEKAVEYFTSKGMGQEFARQEMQKFILYWTEPTPNGKKQKWQKQETFDVKRRLVTWFSRATGNSRSGSNAAFIS